MAVNQGKFHSSPGCTWWGSELQPWGSSNSPGQAKQSTVRDEAHVALLVAGDGGCGGVLSVLGQQLQICTLEGNDSRFPPVKQIPGLRSTPTRWALLLAARACLAPLSILRARSDSALSVEVCSSSVCLGWVCEVAVQVWASLLLFFL